MNKGKLLLSIQRALLFNIKGCIRYIFIETENVCLKLWIYMDKEPIDEDYDIFYAVAEECCGDFEELLESEVQIFFSLEPMENIKHLDRLVYARYE